MKEHGEKTKCNSFLLTPFFVLHPDMRSRCLQVSKEVEEHGDIVLVHEKTNYKSILLKTFFVLEYAIKHYDVRFILKTDDDAYVHVEALVHQLRLLCISPDCRRVHPSYLSWTEIVHGLGSVSSACRRTSACMPADVVC